MPLPRPLLATTTAAILVVTGGALSGCGLLPGNRAADQGEEGITRVTLLAQLPGGGQPAPDTVEQTREVLAHRFDGAGLAEPVIEGTDTGLTITVPGEVDGELLRSLVAPGQLRLRKVWYEADRPGPEELIAFASGAGGDPVSRLDLEAAVRQKVGEPAMAAAQSLATGEQPDLAGEELEEALAAFADLTPAELTVLPAMVQFVLPTISCARLNTRPSAALHPTDQVGTACDDQGTRYLLDTAPVTGADIAGAEASLHPTGNFWQVTLTFTGPGQDRWTALTEEAVANPGVPFDPAQVSSGNHYQGERPVQCETTRNCRVAVVLDNLVISAPEILEAITGPAVLTGNFSQRDAELLAARVRHGPLPLELHPADLEYQPS